MDKDLNEFETIQINIIRHSIIVNGRNPNTLDIWGLSYLHRSSESVPRINTLLDMGANIDVVDRQCRTPLMYSVSSGKSLDAVQLLIDRGCNVHHKDNIGKTVIDHVVDRKTLLAVMRHTGEIGSTNC